MAGHPAYETYWKRKELLKRGPPSFPVLRWWETDGLCEIERVYFEAIRGAASLLDVGAGDLRVMRKLQQAGYRGEYHTLDIGPEGRYTYRDLAEVARPYGAVLCLDTLEHLPSPTASRSSSACRRCSRREAPWCCRRPTRPTSPTPAPGT